uniref:Uncharacterized protein n=1 Tax=Anopheles merus TaxID=30066 RepID=A0A182VEG2_ANOME
MKNREEAFTDVLHLRFERQGYPRTSEVIAITITSASGSSAVPLMLAGTGPRSVVLANALADSLKNVSLPMLPTSALRGLSPGSGAGAVVLYGNPSLGGVGVRERPPGYDYDCKV